MEIFIAHYCIKVKVNFQKEKFASSHTKDIPQARAE